MVRNIIYSSSFLILTSCINCKEFTREIAKEECFIVVTKLATPNIKQFMVEGYNPVTEELTKCESVSNWWNQYNKEIEIGDTIVKRKTQLTFNIHKKDTIISHQWKCFEN